MTEIPFRLNGLQRLSSEHGLDMRGTVLRVATDLYCQAPAHPPGDVARYTDLALALLDTADSDTRRAVAEKLARIPHAPEAVIRRLLEDRDVAVAGAILAASQQLRSDNLPAYVRECGPGEAVAIARRADLDGACLRVLAAHPHVAVVETLIENTAVSFDTAVFDMLIDRVAEHPSLSAPFFARSDLPYARLAPLYPSAPEKIRRRIRESLAAAPVDSSFAVSLDALSGLNQALIDADRELIGRAIANALRIGPARIHAVLDEPTGEVFALALVAAGLKRAPAIHILLVAAHDDVRMSIPRIFAAADILDETPRAVAREIILAVTGEKRARSGSYEPHMHPSTTPQRGASVFRRIGQQRPVRRSDAIGRC